MQSLYARLVLMLALILALVGLAYGLFMFTSIQQNRQYTEQTLNRNLARALVAERNLVHENSLDQQALKNMFQAYMDVNPSIEIYLIDLHGKILSYSADPGKVQRTHVSLEPVHTFLKENAMFPILGDDPRSRHQQKVFSVTPIPSAKHTNGYLYVILRGEQYDQIEQLARDKQLLRLGGWVVGVALLLSLLIGLFVFYPVTRRLRVLSAQVDRFRQDAFKIPPHIQPSSSTDELSQLENNIVLMSDQITYQFEQVSAQDKQRRELFASLSHDLRTPLATLHGYLETLKIKSEDLDAITRDAYVERAIQFSNRLKRLVDELFEMAKLDRCQAMPNREPFALPELVQDILQQFEDAARSGGIQLYMKGDTDLPFVDGDIGLIQRVFENLVSNALRHVQRDGHITITLHKVDHAIEVTVQDSGCGIDADALDYIFDPLYQVNNAHRVGEHAGLGLAIVRRILELHGQQIQVESTPGEGTRFIFSLPTI